MVINAKNKIATVRKLPYDAEIEYLESTGTQWIDTGLNTHGPMSIQFSFIAIPSSSEKDIIGTRSSMTTTQEGSHIIGFYNNFLFAYNKPNQRLDTNSFSQTEQLFNITYTTTLSTRIFNVNDVEYIDNETPVYTEDFNIFIFCGGKRADGTVQNPSQIKLLSSKVYYNDLLVQDLIPVRFTNELGETEGAMYDKVSGELFRNQGSGSFVLGSDLVPYDAEVEYLESTGTQWIDTGVIPSLDTSFEIEFQQISSPYRFAPVAYCGNTYNSNDTFGFCINNNTTGNVIGINSYYGSFSNIHVGDNEFSIGDRLNVKFRIENTNIILTNKSFGTTYSSSLNGTFTSGSRNLYILNGNTETDDLKHPSVMKLYFCKIYSGSILVRDLIPVRKGTVGYMYDRVNPKGGPLGNGLYPNSDEGEFILGKDVAYPNRKFEVTFRKPNIWIKPPTARDYVQDGLIAM